MKKYVIERYIKRDNDPYDYIGSYGRFESVDDLYIYIGRIKKKMFYVL